MTSISSKSADQRTSIYSKVQNEESLHTNEVSFFYPIHRTRTLLQSLVVQIDTFKICLRKRELRIIFCVFDDQYKVVLLMLKSKNPD